MIRRSPSRLALLVTAALFCGVAWGVDETGGEKPDADTHDQTPGASRLHKPPQPVKPQSNPGPLTTTWCVNAHTQCLLSCPRSEESVDAYCSNRCRASLRTCKARVMKVPPSTPSPSGQ